MELMQQCPKCESMFKPSESDTAYQPTPVSPIWCSWECFAAHADPKLAAAPALLEAAQAAEIMLHDYLAGDLLRAAIADATEGTDDAD